MNYWGKQAHPARIPAWSPLAEAPPLPATAVLPTTAGAFVDDLLAEIDGILREQDCLIGFWQAPGE